MLIGQTGALHMSEEPNTAMNTIRRNNSPLDTILPLIGFIGFFGIVLLAISLGSRVTIFINVPSIIVCAGGTIALSCIAFSFHDLIHALLSILRIIIPWSLPKEHITPEDPEILHSMIVYLYASGAIGVLIGAIQVLVSLDDFSGIGAHIATILLCPFYALLGAEGILRPMAHHLKRKLRNA